MDSSAQNDSLVGKFLTVLVVILSLTGCAAFTERSTGVEQGLLTDCPSWPRCVSSAENAERQVEPLRIVGDVQFAWQAARSAVSSMTRTTIVAEQSDYLHAEIKSPWNFYTDDLELLLQPEQRQIAIRSSGRIGYYDFNVNRDRVEMLRAALVKKSVVEPLSSVQ